MISASTAAALLEAQVLPAGERVDRARQQVGRRCSSRPAQEVREQLAALLGEDRLGVELDALGGQLAVADGHHDVAAERALLEHSAAAPGRRPASGSDRPRAARAGPRRSSGRRARSCVVLPCTGSCVHDPPAPRLHERLVAEADAERRDPGLGEAPHRLERDPGLVRRARARARRSPGRSRARAARRPSRGRCAPPRPRRRARPGTGRGCR